VTNPSERPTTNPQFLRERTRRITAYRNGLPGRAAFVDVSLYELAHATPSSVDPTGRLEDARTESLERVGVGAGS
jgi:hypothetical protein